MPNPIDGPSLVQFLADMMKVDATTLPVGWGRLSTQAATLGYAKMLSYAALRGYDAGQYDQSDQARPFTLAQAAAEMGSLGASFGDYSREWFLRLDMWEVFARAKDGMPVLTANGQGIVPGASTVGGISHGTTDAAAALDRGRPDIGCRVRDLFGR